jgi:hypothetical protein
VSGERGQVLPLFAAGLATVVLGLTALVTDVGHGYVVQRRLQADADAAALTGAAELPDGAAAVAAARARLPAGATVAARCLRTTPACTSETPNVLVVTETATVATTFAQVVGIDSLTVRVTSTASRTVSRTPLDVALVVDRTNSMTSQLSSLRAGVAAFLSALDPAQDRVSLIVLPPAGNPCSGDRCDYYPLGNGGYVVDHLTADFARIRNDANALQAFGSTTYLQALVAARAELAANARPGSDRAIVFETDGAANAVPDDAYVQPVSWLDLGSVSIPTGYAASGRLTDVEQPCGSAVSYAGTIGVPVYTVGFELSDDQTCFQAPHRTARTSIGYRSVREAVDAPTALAQIAQRSGGAAFLQEDGSKLASTFVAVATTIEPPRLVVDDS